MTRYYLLRWSQTGFNGETTGSRRFDEDDLDWLVEHCKRYMAKNGKSRRWPVLYEEWEDSEEVVHRKEIREVKAKVGLYA